MHFSCFFLAKNLVMSIKSSNFAGFFVAKWLIGPTQTSWLVGRAEALRTLMSLERKWKTQSVSESTEREKVCPSGQQIN